MTTYLPSPQIEVVVRSLSFLSVLILFLIVEEFFPRRARLVSRYKRWLSNLGIVVLDSIVVRLLFPAAAVGVAIFAEQHQLGLLHIYPMSYGMTVFLSVIALDMVIYFQHVMFHAVPLFWRFHRMHHVDLDFDVTTGVRFHPVEIILSMLIKFGAIILLGAPALSVIIFEVVLNGVTMFNHSNFRLPLMVDRMIRKLIVTPDMHRVHHSDIMTETNSNFGFNLSIWDRLFGTYIAQPQKGHTDMTIGLSDIRDQRYCVSLLGMLWLPFVKDKETFRTG